MALDVERGEVVAAHRCVEEDLDRGRDLEQEGCLALFRSWLLRFRQQQVRQVKKFCEIHVIVELRKAVTVLLPQPIGLEIQPSA